MRKTLIGAVAALAVAAVVLLPSGPVSADPTVTFEPKQPTVQAATPAALCEPAHTGVVGPGSWTPTVTDEAATHAVTMDLHAVCHGGIPADRYDFKVTATTNENCDQGAGSLRVTSGTNSGRIGPFTGAGTLVKAGSEYTLVFNITPVANPTQRYLVTLHVYPDPAAGPVVACFYSRLDLVGHGAIVRL